MIGRADGNDEVFTMRLSQAGKIEPCSCIADAAAALSHWADSGKRPKNPCS